MIPTAEILSLQAAVGADSYIPGRSVAQCLCASAVLAVVAAGRTVSEDGCKRRVFNTRPCTHTHNLASQIIVTLPQVSLISMRDGPARRSLTTLRPLPSLVIAVYFNEDVLVVATQCQGAAVWRFSSELVTDTSISA